MKIAQIAPLIESVPPKKYGGIERVVSTLTEELVKKGHDVTLFATGDSKTSAKLFPLYPKPLREAKTSNLYGVNIGRLLNVGIPYNYQDRFDIIHDHNEPLSVPTANLSTTPVVMTIHSAVDCEAIQLYEQCNRPYLISISEAQIPPSATVNHIETIYHGFNMEGYPFSPTNDGYLLYVGRVSPAKGLHNAIAVAKKMQKQLIIAAKLDDKDTAYFKEQIEPHLSEQILWIGEVNEEERNQLMSRALCFLHPVTWNEPFGLTMIEAMACGAPVVAFGLGSIPEIVLDGKTGYVVNTLEEMVQAVSRIEKIERLICRQWALSNFNAKKMADEYEMVYEAILEGKYSKQYRHNGHQIKNSSLLPRDGSRESFN